MRTIEDYMAMPYRMEIVEDSDEGGFVASYPDLPGCISCGETVEAAAANAQDAKRAWLEAAMEDGIAIREPDSLDDYSGQFKLRIPKSLHRSLAEHSQREGISMNQYCVYLLSRNDAVYSKQLRSRFGIFRRLLQKNSETGIFIDQMPNIFYNRNRYPNLKGDKA